ncbi:hypothetical protein [Geoalkalibacter sp.]|uniref:hypothetical protein n=1 Tax=Geoalkalibacter sp. TaxID=3041440 RepID=UPI00272E1475|nr:hypothetical protein [Geoalkalibacter sp.]
MDEVVKRLERIERTLDEVLDRLGRVPQGARTELERSATRLDILAAADKKGRLAVLKSLNDGRRRK